MKNNREIFYRVFFFLLPVIYFLLYGPYGFDDVDGGYTISSVYRFVNGQVPYKDFILVRPPLSVFLHSIPFLVFPSDYLLIIERFIIYLNFAFVAWLSMVIINRFFDLKKLTLNKYLLASIIFIFSVHNYPPMTIHTTDGILLGIIGIYFLSVRNSTFSVCLGMFFLLGSALTKQSFYPMPVAGLCYLWFTERKKVFPGIISLILFACTIYFFASKYDLIQPFIFWTKGSTHLKDVIRAGVNQYVNVQVRDHKLLLIVIGGFLIIKFLFQWIKKIKISYGWLLPLYAAKTFIQIILFSYYCHGLFYETSNPYSYPQFFFIVTLIGIVWYFFNKRKLNADLITLCFLLSLSWCSSISWGFRTPILFSAPLIFGVIWMNGELFNFQYRKFSYNFLLIGGLITFYVAYYYCPIRSACTPNRDSIRSEFVYDMGKIFPKLSYIKSDKETYDKYSELKQLAGKYNNHFKTLPDMVLSNYLTESVSPIAIDWVMDKEINNHVPEITDQLNKSNCFVFVDKDKMERFASDTSELSKHYRDAKSSLTTYVINHWDKIDDTQYFNVYWKPANIN